MKNWTKYYYCCCYSFTVNGSISWSHERNRLVTQLASTVSLQSNAT